MTTLVLAVVALGVGTFAFRSAGPALRSRLELSSQVEQIIAITAVVLLTAMVATTALADGGAFNSIARPVGVAVGGVLAWRRVPFVIVVVAAAATAAGLRLLGVP